MEQQLGHYKIIELIGRGGMGSVYKAHEMSLNRIVALKVLGEHLTEDETNISRFRREARSVAALNHPNVIQIYFIGEDKGQHYFVMEFVDGVTLKDLISGQERPAVKESLSLIRQAAVGLAAAHDRGLIHRDIKPANIMVNTDGIVKIADFGLAFRPEDQTKLTASGMFLGTPGYLAPEQCTGDPLDARTDVYALGMTLYELLVGRSAYGEDSLPPLALIHRVMHEQPENISKVNPQVDSQVEAIVNRMIAKRCEDRYPSCHQLLADLDTVLGPSQSIWRPVPETMPLPAAAPPPMPTPPTATVSQRATEIVQDDSQGGAIQRGPQLPPPMSFEVPQKPRSSMSGKTMIWIGVAAGVFLIAAIAVGIGIAMKGDSGQVTEVRPEKLAITQVQSSVGDDPETSAESERPFESDQFFVQDENRPDTESDVQELNREEAKGKIEPHTETQPKTRVVTEKDTATSPQRDVGSKKRETAPVETEKAEKQAVPVKTDPVVKPGVAACMQKLRAADDAQKRQAAKIIVKRFPNNARLLNAAKAELLAGYNLKSDDKLHVDTMAWLCRALGNSGDREFVATLKMVAEKTKSKKIKKFAKAGIKRLE